jgi:tRNA (guanine-N7-)-methyltransferase
MRYNVVKNANEIINNSSYLIKNPRDYKNKWSSLFGNNNPICLELGMGRGSFIIGMAKAHPNINYIGLESDKNQTAAAINNIGSSNLKNLKIICADASNIIEFFLNFYAFFGIFISPSSQKAPYQPLSTY